MSKRRRPPPLRARKGALAARLLKRETMRFALSTLCIGGGQGIATILEAA